LAPLTLHWTRRALQNLEQEADYIAKDDPDAAVLVMTRIHDAITLLQSNPELGRAGRVAGTRELVVPKTRYLIPYRIRGEQIQILRVFHTSRKLPVKERPPVAERIQKGLREAISHERGEITLRTREVHIPDPPESPPARRRQGPPT